MHQPGAKVKMVNPDTVHTCGLVEVSNTGSPELADVAEATGIPTGTPPLTTSGGSVRVTVCVASPVVTWNDRVSGGAAA